MVLSINKIDHQDKSIIMFYTYLSLKKDISYINKEMFDQYLKVHEESDEIDLF